MILEDSQVFTGNFELVAFNLVDAQQDDDLESDEETMCGGKKIVLE